MQDTQTRALSSLNEDLVILGVRLLQHGKCRANVSAELLDISGQSDFGCWFWKSISQDPSGGCGSDSLGGRTDVFLQIRFKCAVVILYDHHLWIHGQTVHVDFASRDFSEQIGDVDC